MIGLLADHNVELQARLIWTVFSDREWRDFGVTAQLRLEDCGLPVDVSDRTLWSYCQRHSLVLITANRNQSGEDSLETAIEQLNDATSLPVLTIGRAGSVVELSYREECAYRIATSPFVCQNCAARVGSIFRSSCWIHAFWSS
jgi:hypothetical protein